MTTKVTIELTDQEVDLVMKFCFLRPLRNAQLLLPETEAGSECAMDLEEIEDIEKIRFKLADALRASWV